MQWFWASNVYTATTGKTTTPHIAERMASEAKALLKHTYWNVSEISYSLGFEQPAHEDRHP